jgi:hypothetical protein
LAAAGNPFRSDLLDSGGDAQVAQMAESKRYRSLDAWAEELHPLWPVLVPGERGMDAWLAAGVRTVR